MSYERVPSAGDEKLNPIVIDPAPPRASAAAAAASGTAPLQQPLTAEPAGEGTLWGWCSGGGADGTVLYLSVCCVLRAATAVVGSGVPNMW